MNDYSQHRLLRPQTISEALQLLHEHAALIRLRGDDSTQKRGAGTAEYILDTATIREMSGIHQFGGYIVIGCNMSLADIIYSSLIRTKAMCLKEACEAEPLAAAGTLGNHLQHVSPPTLIDLALITLSAEVEYAFLKNEGEVVRTWQPWKRSFPAAASDRVRLTLAIRFASSSASSGSALVQAEQLRGVRSPVHAAAARLILDPEKVVGEAYIALNLDEDHPVRIDEAERQLVGRSITPDNINTAAMLAGKVITERTQIPASGPTYPINLAHHLVRRVLDRTAARANADHISI